VLQRELGADYEVIAEGLSGRTTVWPDPVEGEYKSGKNHLIACLESHYPLDLVVILLGTNDLKHRFGQSAWDIARSAATLVQMVMGTPFGPDGAAPETLLIAPPPTCVAGTLFEGMFAGADAKSADLGLRFREMAAELGCAFLDAGQIIVSTKLDGIHLDASEQVKLGQAVAAEVRKILG
jgi:lysophospholipase L1-like esterase